MNHSKFSKKIVSSQRAGTAPAELISLLDRPIAYHSCLARVAGGVTAGVMLSQAIYWQRRAPGGRGGWWYKTMEDWQEETAMSRAELETARRRLRQLSVLEEERRGVPARIFYRLDLPLLGELLLGAAAKPPQEQEQEQEQDSPPAQPPTQAQEQEQKQDPPPAQPPTQAQEQETIEEYVLFALQNLKNAKDLGAVEVGIRKRLGRQGGLLDADRRQLAQWTAPPAPPRKSNAEELVESYPLEPPEVIERGREQARLLAQLAQQGRLGEVLGRGLGG